MKGWTADTEHSQADLRRAWDALQQGDRSEAKRRARAAVQSDPNCEGAWLILAALSKPAAGLAYARKALRINPDSVGAREAVADLERRLAQPAGGSRRPAAAAGAVFEDDRLGAKRGLWLDSWRAFRRHRTAVVGLLILVLFIVIAAATRLVTPYDHNYVNLQQVGVGPMTRFEPDADALEACHWKGTILEVGCGLYLAGTDRNGRDLWSRTLYGTRVSLIVATLASLTSMLIGIIYGSAAGYAGGQTDEIMMRFVDFLYSIPVFLVVLGIQSFFRTWMSFSGGLLGKLEELNNLFGGLLFLFVAIGAVNWVGMARLSRALVHAHRQKEYIEAARALGASEVQILVRHLLPNIIGPLVVMETIAMPGYIFLEATLTFVGLGVVETTRYQIGSATTIGPSWGGMIRDGYPGLRTSPNLILFPSMALTLLTLAVNFIGDGLRDAIDPMSRKR